MTKVLDTLLDGQSSSRLDYFSPVLTFPFRTGWENPHVRNITSLTYLFRGTWIVNKNLDKWRANAGRVIPSRFAGSDDQPLQWQMWHVPVSIYGPLAAARSDD